MARNAGPDYHLTRVDAHIKAQATGVRGNNEVHMARRYGGRRTGSYFFASLKTKDSFCSFQDDGLQTVVTGPFPVRISDDEFSFGYACQSD
jgi:hypothetical protein